MNSFCKMGQYIQLYICICYIYIYSVLTFTNKWVKFQPEPQWLSLWVLVKYLVYIHFWMLPYCVLLQAKFLLSNSHSFAGSLASSLIRFQLGITQLQFSTRTLTNIFLYLFLLRAILFLNSMTSRMQCFCSSTMLWLPCWFLKDTFSYSL